MIADHFQNEIPDDLPNQRDIEIHLVAQVCILGCSSVDHHTCIVHHASQINFTRDKQSTDIVKMRRLAHALALGLSFLARAVGSLAMSNLAFSFGKSVWT